MFLLLSFITTKTFSQPKAIPVHDPVIIRQDGTYYIFATGKGIKVWSSKDLKSWKPEMSVFNTPPEWATTAVLGFKDNIWAPDISFYKGAYYLYYSVSTFGKNNSAIGLATNKTLNSNDPNYHWVDHGEVIKSVSGRDNWNAIDPNFTVDKKGKPWLAFGSFWGGLKLVRLSDDGFKISTPPALVPLASRNESGKAPNPIEAPFMFRKGKWFYLFASIDYCCKGPASTYKIIVGRSKNFKGPYTDKEGTDLKNGGGSILRKGDENWYGLGHNAVSSFDGTDYLIYHGYDSKDKGAPKLIINKLNWQKGWPVTEEI